MGLSFYWDTFGIKEMIGKKMFTLSFGGVVLGASQACAPIWGHLMLGLTCSCALGRKAALGLACPCPRHKQGLRPHVGTSRVWAVCPWVRSNLRVTWSWALPCPGCTVRPEHHVALGLACLYPECIARPEQHVALGLVCHCLGHEPSPRLHVALGLPCPGHCQTHTSRGKT